MILAGQLRISICIQVGCGDVWDTAFTSMSGDCEWNFLIWHGTVIGLPSVQSHSWTEATP